LPGDFIAERPVNSFIQPAGLPTTTPHQEVLQRPRESALRALMGVADEARGGPATVNGHLQRVDDEL
jgi:hypothetical protein